MGLDFAALIRYGGPCDDVVHAIAQLEGGDEDAALVEVTACGLHNDFAFAKRPREPAFWRSSSDLDQRLAGRPPLPTLATCLELPCGFTLTFGRDTVCVYHTLRWMFFLSEEEWQRVMLAALDKLCASLGGIDCVVTNDAHPAVLAFQEGASFEDALRAAECKGEGRVERIESLYVDKGYAEPLVYAGPRGEQYAIPVWDTHGYWRFRRQSDEQKRPD
jgi:hypothetical protein